MTVIIIIIIITIITGEGIQAAGLLSLAGQCKAWSYEMVMMEF